MEHWRLCFCNKKINWKGERKIATRIVEINEKVGENSTDIIHPITSADAVQETESKKFITSTEKQQITTNQTNITNLTNETNDLDDRVTELEQEVGIDGSGTSGTLVDRVTNLENFANTKNKANGIAGLDNSGKITFSQLPDVIFGQLTYKGTWNPATNKFVSWSDLGDPAGTATMDDYSLATKSQTQTYTYDTKIGAMDSENKRYYPAIGQYWIATSSGTFDGLTFVTGDWIVFNDPGHGYGKVDNTDAVSAVAGLTGNISVDALKTALGLNNVSNIPDSLKEVLSATKLKTARTFNVSGDAMGTAQTFDGTQNVVIPITLANGVVTTVKIANNAITSEKIADGAVTANKIANNAVGTNQIANGAVSTQKLSNSGVTAGTYSVVQVNEKGIVTSGGQLIIVSDDSAVPSSLPIGGLWFKVVE